MIDINTKDIRAGDRIGVLLEVMQTNGGPRVMVAGHDYDLTRFEVTAHEKGIREDDYVTFPGSTSGVFARVAHLLDAGGVVQPRGAGREACYACIVAERERDTDLSPPRIFRTDQLVRQDGKPKR